MRMRHRRRSEFDAALAGSSAGAPPARWTDIGPEPSMPAAIVARAATIRAAARPWVPDRIGFLRDRCRDRRVLDLGCVAHDPRRAASPSWLHTELASVAAECVGVDILEDGIRALRDQGLNVVCHDFADGLGPFADHEPYDVIVAGELIEHLGSPEMLFGTASKLLGEGGVMILTSPNPWAPDRSRAGRKGVVYENVDHVLYCFPSGIAELSERAGLRLVEVMSTPPRRPFPAGVLRHAKRWIKGSNWVNVGVTTRGAQRAVRVGRRWRVPGRDDRDLSGETLIYVVGRPR